MCGIAGYIESSSNLHPSLPLERMMDRIQHRGPDGHGKWIHDEGAWRVALGHRRLSIIDLERGGQPFASADGAFQLTFNGEIFNFLELKPALEALGTKFRTHSDTEVLLESLISLGADSLSTLNGMFAFGFWDNRRGELLLARDRAGIKPLYYTELPGGGIAFASELSALLQHPQVARALSAEGLQGYFFSDYVHTPDTIIEGIHKLSPGHCLTWKAGKIVGPLPYWSLESLPALTLPRTEEELLSQLRAKLERAVERQLIADVPVGVFLSGGIDSSLVTAVAQAQRSTRLKTFTIAFDDKDFDESTFAAEVAKHLGTDHHVESFNEAKLLGLMDEALNFLDEPNADPSVLPTYCVSRLAAREVKVVLGGDGGDELWGGYPTYRAHRLSEWYSRVPATLRHRALEMLIGNLPVNPTYQSLEWKLKRFALRWDKDMVRRHLRWMSNSDLPLLKELIPSRAAMEPQILRTRIPSTLAADENRWLGIDFQTYMPGSVLAKVDRMSMAHGLEVRPPLLDGEFVDWSLRVPFQFKLRGKRSKYLLREVSKKYLPAGIVDRPKKGFAIPLTRWMLGPLQDKVDAALAYRPLWDSGVLNQAAFARCWTELKDRRFDHSKPLWAMIVLAHWMRKEKISEFAS